MQDTPKTLVYLLHTLAHNKIRNSETSVSSPQLQEPGAYTMPIMRTPCTFSGGGDLGIFTQSRSHRSRPGANAAHRSSFTINLHPKARILSLSKCQALYIPPSYSPKKTSYPQRRGDASVPPVIQYIRTPVRATSVRPAIFLVMGVRKG